MQAYLGVAMALSLALPDASRLAVAGRGDAVRPEPPVTRNWVANCSIPWMPECEEVRDIQLSSPSRH